MKHIGHQSFEDVEASFSSACEWDDHLRVRRAFKGLLEDNVDITVVAEASNGYEILDAIRHGSVDLVLFDLNMPGKGGVETVMDLKHDIRISRY